MNTVLLNFSNENETWLSQGRHIVIAFPLHVTDMNKDVTNSDTREIYNQYLGTTRLSFLVLKTPHKWFEQQAGENEYF